MTTIERYQHLRERASFHFADDSAKEWDEGYKLSSEANQLKRDLIAIGVDPLALDAIDSRNLL